MLFEPAVDRYRHRRRSGGSNGRTATFDRDRIRDPFDKAMFGRLGFSGKLPDRIGGRLSIIVATDSFVSQVTDRKHYDTPNRYTAFDHRHRIGIPVWAQCRFGGDCGRQRCHRRDVSASETSNSPAHSRLEMHRLRLPESIGRTLRRTDAEISYVISFAKCCPRSYAVYRTSAVICGAD